MLNKKFVGALSISLGLVSAQASAQAFLGATVGKTTWRESCTSNANYCLSELGKSNASKVVGGYDFSNHWGIEASAYNNGTLRATQGALLAEVKSSGVDVAAAFRFGFGDSRFGGFVKLGAAADRGETKLSSSRFGSFGSTSKTSVQPVFGVGLSYDFNENVSARFDIESRHTKSSANSDGSYAANTNLGLVFHFR